MKSSLVSIIVPVYNVAEYLDECLESICKQSYKNIEVLLINDGSTDNSEKICKDYCKTNKNFHLYNKENGGLSSARNYGLDRCKGEYICFIDSDDIIGKNYISCLLNGIEKEKANISCCKLHRFKNIIEINRDYDFDNIESLGSMEYMKKTLYQQNQLLYSVSVCNKMYHKSIFSNIRFPENKLYEDVAIFCDTMESTNKVALIDQFLYFYRIRSNSITTSKWNEKKVDIIEHCHAIIKKYSKNKNILAAANTLLYSRSFELLLIMKQCKSDDKDLEKHLWSNIKGYRKDILHDAYARKIAKISAVCSYFGKHFSLLIMSAFRRAKYLMNKE